MDIAHGVFSANLIGLRQWMDQDLVLDVMLDCQGLDFGFNCFLVCRVEFTQVIKMELPLCPSLLGDERVKFPDQLLDLCGHD
ncbi:MAG: hypothetical protein V3V76_03240 [Candidatus Adiutricales bacterium]